MSWRTVVITGSAKLDFRMGFLSVRKERVTKIHLSEIGVLLIESTAVSVTAALLCELMKRKIKVIFCDEKHQPNSELLPYYGAHDTSVKIKRQMGWNSEIKTLIWTEIVSEKIRRQAALLRKKHKPEAALLERYLREMKIGDATNREGHAAKVYFNALFGMDFTRAADNSVNAALNYGYGILLSVVNREIAANGYLTQLGLFHDNMFNPFNLGSDLMEPFRPLVDEAVSRMEPKQFEHEEKMEILALLQEEVRIAGRKEILLNAIKIFCKSVFEAINEEDVSLIKFYGDENSLYESDGIF